MSANDITYQVILDSIGIKAFIMPEGYFPDVEIHCWGAGGSGFGAGALGAGSEDTYQRYVYKQSDLYTGYSGSGGTYSIYTSTETITVPSGTIPTPGSPLKASPGPGGTSYSAWTKISSSIGVAGGSAGYARTTVNINPGDEVVLQVGQPGLSTGLGGIDNTYRILRGGTGSGGGGGGGASWVVVEDTMVCCGGGGGGAASGGAGSSGGNTTKGLAKDSRGQDGSGGGGGGGFPNGGIASNQGGGGGQNFGNLTIAGSGTIPGGTATAYYPGNKIGEAGYPGYVILILRKKFNTFIKNPNTSGDWVRANIAYVKTPSQSVTVSQAVGAQTTTYNSVGTNTFTVPAGVTSIQLTVIGGGGGGGGADSSPGSAGRTGARASGTLAVSPGQILTLSVGSGGSGGTSDQGSAPGGVGGTNSLGYSGGRGSAAGPTPISGGGGGGGAASAVLVNGSPIVVAAGGGGGGGGGNGVPGQGVSPGGTSGGIAGGAGTAKGGDGGGAGGGGGGYPLGGAGGNVGGGDVGGFSGADGQSLVPAGFSLGEGGAGGIAAIRGSRASGGGGGGSVTISYTPAPVNVTIVTGGWKQIQRAFTKVDNEWKPLLINQPIDLYSYPVKRRAATINVVVPTYDFVVYDALPIVYFEGLMDVNVYVAANTTVGSTDVTTPALLVNQFGSGDNVKISNYGNIAGRGGDGGAAGSFFGTVVGTGGIYNKGTTVVYTSIPGRPGQFGGAGLRLDSPAVIENYGTIAGGGGGGGGGGGPTGGQGGGGAGVFPGNGGNNGTSTAGGAGLGLGGAGAARGTRGTDGTNSSSAGGLGGASGPAVVGILNATFTVTGTRIGPLT
jgi:hypothetical protein